MRKAKPNMSSVKEAIDNLPSGVCYFDSRDILRLCNRQMYRLGFALAGIELQSRENLGAVLANPSAERGITRDGETYLFPDGSVWKFQKKSVTDKNGKVWTEYLAFDVSELYRKKQELEKSNAEQREVMKRLTNIARNVVSIAREEEILSMKMRIHNELGMSLQSTRQFFATGCPEEARKQYIAEQEKMSQILCGEVGNDDEVNAYTELKRIADRLDMKVITTGELPKDKELMNLLAMAVCECMTNTVRHAQGSEVYVNIENSDGIIVVITNNGKPPKCEIAEGGGLSSLREKVERSGGEMLVVGLPEFRLTITLPQKETVL